MIDETELLLDGLTANDARIRSDAVSRLLQVGATVDDRLRERFPGDIGFNPLDATVRVPPFARCSGLTELLAARGASAASIALAHLDSDDPAKRFFAIYFLMAVPYPPAIEALARRLYDNEPRNRQLAADALRVYPKEPALQRILEAVRAQLNVPVLSSQVSAVQLLGQLRDPASVPLLIPLVVSPSKELATAAAGSLSTICGQQYGHDVTQWSEWWRACYNRPRPVWLLEGLVHGDPAVRRIANYELQVMTGLTTNFDADAPDNQRQAAAEMWHNWWRQVSATSSPPPPAG